MAFFAKLDKALNRLYDVCGVVAALLLISLALCVLLSISTRALSTYIPGLTEYSGYAMAGSSFLALAYTFREGGHIRVALLRSHLRGKAKWLVEIWCFGLAVMFSSFLAWYIIKMTWLSHRFEEKSEGADAILLWIPQTLTAVGSTIMAICCLHGLIKIIASRNPDAFITKAEEL